MADIDVQSIRQLLSLDATPLDTDWSDIHDLWDDMEKFGREHPGHMFICADDPGCNHDPPSRTSLSSERLLPLTSSTHSPRYRTGMKGLG